MPIQNDTVLQRLSSLDLHLYSDNTIRIRFDAGELLCGSHGLAILDAFARPTPFSVALENLKGRAAGVQDWMLLTHTMVELFEAGVLRRPDEMKVELTTDRRRFDSYQMHADMLNDQARTRAYLSAIPQLIRPGDVVLEIGTGTGLLAVAAAKAGARRVYAVEAGCMGKAAQAVFAANGVADRITLVEGWSTEITLPEKANVLLSEIVSNDGFGERILEFTLDARQRLLTPDARQIPTRLRMYGLPVTASEAWLSERVFTSEAVRQWSAWYGINFDPLATLAPASFVAGCAGAEDVRRWRTLGAPQLLAEVDLTTLDSLVVEHRGNFAIETAGLWNAVAVYFELTLAPAIQISTHPLTQEMQSHWGNPVVLVDARHVEAGTVRPFTYRRGAAKGEPTLSVGPAPE